LVASRQHAYFVDMADFQSRAQMKMPMGDGDLSVKTNFFLVYSKVRLERSNVEMQALIFRKGTGNTNIVWLRES
jgi:general secretion pathway protein K